MGIWLNIAYRIAGIFRGYKFSQMDHYKGFRGFYFRGLSSSLLAHAHINMQHLHTVSLESIYWTCLLFINFRGTGSIRENREHLYPRNIPTIRYPAVVYIVSCMPSSLHTPLLLHYTAFYRIHWGGRFGFVDHTPYYMLIQLHIARINDVNNFNLEGRFTITHLRHWT